MQGAQRCSAQTCRGGEFGKEQPGGDLDGAKDADRLIKPAVCLKWLRWLTGADGAITLAARDAPCVDSIKPHALKCSGAGKCGHGTNCTYPDIPEGVNKRWANRQASSREWCEECADLLVLDDQWRARVRLAGGL